ncbi:MAG TPA: serine/threonine-protein kinase [Haliangium sp.]|nr:serine/threonine-protein kinase [Haliangium sp.]
MSTERYDTPVLASNRLGRYHLGERLGEGGMAEVFRAETTGAAGFTKAVAIKRIRPDLATDEHITAMFLQEAQVARRLEHGGIVQIYDLGSEDGVPYLVIELVDGVSLDRILRDRDGRLEAADALQLVEHVAAALHHAHRLTDAAGQPTPVVHRDVNPRNILVSRDGVVKLTDFGIAKAWHLPSATLPGTVKGTLGYLSPEQAAGAPVDAHTDQFSTGVVLYELLAGENPLAGTDSLVAYCRLLDQGLPRLPVGGAIDDALADIVARAVAVKPGDRFPGMEDLRGELEAWRVSRGVRTSAEGLRRRVRAILGVAAGHQPAPVALGNALRAQLAARAGQPADARPLATTAVAAPAARRTLGRTSAIRTFGRPVAMTLAGALALAVGVVAWRQRPPTRPPDLASAVSEHTPAVVEAGLVAVAPAPLATPAALPADAAVPAPAVSGAVAPAPPRPGDAGRPGARPRVAGGGLGAGPGARSAPSSPAAEPGRLKINLLPYARITIDGQSRGQTPVDLSLPAGAHQLVLENPDTGQRSERRIDVAPGQTLVIHQW